jgi:hypothetical protein
MNYLNFINQIYKSENKNELEKNLYLCYKNNINENIYDCKNLSNIDNLDKFTKELNKKYYIYLLNDENYRIKDYILSNKIKDTLVKKVNIIN